MVHDLLTIISLDEADYAKTQGIAQKVSEWIEAGIPIDGIGMSFHLKIFTCIPG